MQKKRLGNSDMEISTIGLGAWAIGGPGSKISWGPQDDNDSIAAIHKAIDLGVNWIDTAPAYGLGHSEEVVARALKGHSNKPYVFTKCSLLWDEAGEIHNDLSQIRQELENSLRRLQTDTIDLYQMHWPKPEEQISEAWSTMAKLQQEGKVRWIGVSNFSAAQMELVGKIAPITSNQPPYSMINRAIEAEVLPYSAVHNIGTIAYAPMHSGLLTGAMTRERIAAFPEDDFRKRAKNYQEPQITRNLAIADLLKQIGAGHNVPAGVVAIAWTQRNPAVTASIVGGRNAQQVEQIVTHSGFRLSTDELAQIDTFLAEHP
ncbi:aldo/keto reductase [Terriglobus saanensis]|uniref:Aldo/keto reductase n=1 Tax=Terriglobus saanensis (strain ATCC BAA-1853 / DSM 23119 / SP1PR4) TaxID=401053 RepID=E8V3B2_TERSS|nr:aldo/keto reductase [Terriglobus saanensis]ADV82469.1 aldo/keto reductase [Terriglobus saanensis SP1PR4]